MSAAVIPCEKNPDLEPMLVAWLKTELSSKGSR
jgi:hypothetical protein